METIDLIVTIGMLTVTAICIGFALLDLRKQLNNNKKKKGKK